MQTQDQLTAENIKPTQFQVNGNPEENETQEETTGVEEIGYTPGETEYADGAGTSLDHEIEDLETDPDPDSDEEVDEDNDDELDPETNDEDADFENPEDDPA